MYKRRECQRSQNSMQAQLAKTNSLSTVSSHATRCSLRERVLSRVAREADEIHVYSYTYVLCGISLRDTAESQIWIMLGNRFVKDSVPGANP